ncbi:putative nk-2 homeobox protein [Schistosoma mansoni]|uniref:putative nk-2 homeobox protein n=1 Tax=Schistosoma mansoni TaxID=6183 RepID=UPI0001A63BD2|nr:putative nk-2 homeobox protein [Schistosoma mansoni]|eukprot:XP_018651328.1 putative nk-2 homeobox protein [Schistosoma mansoni]
MWKVKIWFQNRRYKLKRQVQDKNLEEASALHHHLQTYSIPLLQQSTELCNHATSITNSSLYNIVNQVDDVYHQIQNRTRFPEMNTYEWANIFSQTYSNNTTTTVTAAGITNNGRNTISYSMEPAFSNPLINSDKISSSLTNLNEERSTKYPSQFSSLSSYSDSNVNNNNYSYNHDDLTKILNSNSSLNNVTPQVDLSVSFLNSIKNQPNQSLRNFCNSDLYDNYFVMKKHLQSLPTSSQLTSTIDITTGFPLFSSTAALTSESSVVSETPNTTETYMKLEQFHQNPNWFPNNLFFSSNLSNHSNNDLAMSTSKDRSQFNQTNTIFPLSTYNEYNEEIQNIRNNDSNLPHYMTKINLEYQTVLNVAKAAFQCENMILNKKRIPFTNHTVLETNEQENNEEEEEDDGCHRNQTDEENDKSDEFIAYREYQ